MKNSETSFTVSDVWAFVTSQNDVTLIVAGSFIFVIIMAIIIRSRQPAFEHDDKKLESDAFLKVYPLCVLACWLAILAGLTLVGMGVAGHLGYINIDGVFGTMTPLEIALYACAIPFGAAMGLWRFADKKKEALARVAARKEAATKAGPVRSY